MNGLHSSSRVNLPVEPQRLDSIDALRGFAALGVVTVHTSQCVGPSSNPLITLAQQGSYGVQLFYVISAFTLFFSLSIRQSAETHLTRNFLIRRFCRIAPLFWCAMAFYLLRDGLGPRYWLGDAPSVTPLNLLATATFTNGFNPYWINSVVPAGWSVAVEMMFYLTVPFLYRKIKSANTAWACTFAWLVLSILVLKLGEFLVPITDNRLWVDFLYFWLPNQMPVFGLGFVLYFIFCRLQPALPHLHKKKTQSAALLVTSFCAVGVLCYCDYKAMPVHFLYGLVFLCVAIALLLHPFRLIVNGLTTSIGKISYSVYLTHSAVIPLAERFVRGMSRRLDWYLSPLPQFALLMLLVVGGTLAVSALTYRLIELPGQNLGRRIIAALRGKSTA